MNCFSTGFRAGDKENRNIAHWITTKIASADPNFRGNACTKALRTKKQSESEREVGEKGKETKREFSSYSKFGHYPFSLHSGICVHLCHFLSSHKLGIHMYLFIYLCCAHTQHKSVDLGATYGHLKIKKKGKTRKMEPPSPPLKTKI